jgi:hypothetical protein
MTDVMHVADTTVTVEDQTVEALHVGYIAQTVTEGGGTPSGSVVPETSYGQAAAAGAATAYARGDHTHGTPSLGTTGTTAAAGNHNHSGVYDAAGAATTAVTAHEADTTAVHGIPDTTALALKPIIRQAYLTSGLVTLPNTSGAWQVLNQAGGSPFELDVPAVSGEYVDITLSAVLENAASTDSVDIGVVVGSSIVRYMSSGGSSPTSRGLYWCLQQSPAQFGVPSSPMGFTVTPGDLDGGNIRFSVAVKAAGAATLYAISAFPFYWRGFNHRTPG